jgi:hypothetical protein
MVWHRISTGLAQAFRVNTPAGCQRTPRPAVAFQRKGSKAKLNFILKIPSGSIAS